jgi:hypothetical protein
VQTLPAQLFQQSRTLLVMIDDPDGHKLGAPKSVREGLGGLCHHGRVNWGGLSRQPLQHGTREQKRAHQRRHRIARQGQNCQPMRPIASGLPGFSASESLVQLPPTPRTEAMTWSASLPETPPEQIRRSNTFAGRAICLLRRGGSSGQQSSVRRSRAGDANKACSIGPLLS